MKLIPFFALACLTGSACSALAATNVSYTATADPNTSPDGVDNNGNAVDVWTLTHSGDGTAPNNYGSFLGNSGSNGGGSGAGAGTSAWGIYANVNGVSSGNNEVDIGHTFDGGALNVGQSVSLNFDGGYVDNGHSYGIRMYGASGFVLALSFSGGDSAYRYYDAGPGGNSAGFGYDADGFNFKYTQTGATTYSVIVTNGSTTLGAFSGTVSGAPTFIQVYNASAGSGSAYDVFANNLAVVPEPGGMWGGAAAAGLALAAFGLRRSKTAKVF